MDMRLYEENGSLEKENGKSEYRGRMNCDGLIHVIQPGDTLYRLSQVYHVSVSEIMYKNPYANVYNLRVGDELCIPVARRKK
ncbi:MAG: LysM peptidoglycan-binding domain-containing protein [Clostridiales bacterium]|nr:LysM peptidoglycan-binding domain-containing protein [Clostridiales bacterium]